MHIETAEIAKATIAKPATKSKYAHLTILATKYINAQFPKLSGEEKAKAIKKEENRLYKLDLAERKKAKE